MNIKPTHNKLKWATCLMACLPYSAANALYSVTDLGSLGGTYSLGLGVNSKGQAVGFSHLLDNVSEHAVFVDTLSSSPLDLATLGGLYSQAYSINNLGQVVGSSSLNGDALYHAFYWELGSKLTHLNPLVDPGYSRAFSINDSGVATGFSLTATDTEHAVIWKDVAGVTTIKDLGTLDGTGNSYGHGINLSGQVAGYSSLSTKKFPHAVVWDTNGKPQDLGTLGSPDLYSAAYAINVRGEVTGISACSPTSANPCNEGDQHAFVWQPNSIPQMIDINTLGGIGGDHSVGRGISDAGVVVGFGTGTANGDARAFIWHPGDQALQDLNNLLEPPQNPATSWTLLEAHAISEDGRYIIGIGCIGSTVKCERRAFLLTDLNKDTTPPIIVVANITQEATSSAGAVVTFAPNATDTGGSGVAGVVSCAPVSGTSFPLGSNPATNKVTCSATDNAGNKSLPTSFVVTVVDTTPPVLTVPASFSQASTLVTYTTTATDAVTINPTVSCIPASGSIFSVGPPTTVACTATDNAGNSSSASFLVTITETVPPPVKDQTPPVIVVADITQEATGPDGAVVSYALPTATDTDSGVNAAGVICLPISGTATFLLGSNPATNTVTCSATDNAGNSSIPTSFVVTVVDTTPPALTVPASFSQASAVVTYTATATDAVTANPTVSCNPASGSTFAVGSTTPVTCTATDNAGNSASASFTVTVTEASPPPPPPTDQTPPVISVADITQEATGSDGAVVSYALPTATDTDSGVNAAGVICLPISGTATFPLGSNPATNTVTCSATDNAGNSSIPTSFVVTVVDTTPPVLTVPASFSRVATSPAGAVVTYVTSATDSVTVSPVISCDIASGSTFPLGSDPATNKVTCSATDIAGNSSNPASFLVTVEAPQVPTAEVIKVTRASCTSRNGTFGNWTVSGNSTLSTNNRIQLYLTGSVPDDLTSNKLGSTRVSRGKWLFQSGRRGPACTSPISLRSTAGTVSEEIPVTVR
jgi:probable HAF family extracellular repeat protein